MILRKIYVILFFLLSFSGLCQSQNVVLKGLEKAAMDGELSAQIHLGDCYYNGTLGCSKNIEKAQYYYQLASKQGDAEAFYKLAQVLRYKGMKSDEDVKTFFVYLQTSANKGYVLAQYALGMELMNIKEPDCFEFLKKAADKGMLEACYSLGLCYMQGLGCNANYSKAMEFLGKGMETVSEGEYVGDMALCSLRLEDYDKARLFAQKGVTLGQPMAYQIMAGLYFEGKGGLSRDSEEALKYIDFALSIDPNNVSYKDMKGYILLAQGKIQEAENVWNELVLNNNEFALSSQTEFCITMRTGKSDNVDLNIVSEDGKNMNTFVAIIANENYRREASVPFALNDGKVFGEYCRKILCVPEENIKIFQDATFNDIKYGINWLKQIANTCKGNAHVIFYYAGHGIPAEDQTTSYLLPTDGYGTDISTGYDLKALYEALGSINAQNVIVFLDACFSGAKRDGGMLSNVRGVAIKPKQNLPLDNMVVISAANGDETAYPYSKQNHGLFTYYLLKKLRETKGEASLGEIYKYVSNEVTKQSILENGKSQTPNVISGMNVSWETIRLK